MGYNPRDVEIPESKLDTISLFSRAFNKLIRYKKSLEYILEAAEKSIGYNPVPLKILPNNEELNMDSDEKLMFASDEYIRRVQKNVLRASSFMLRHKEYSYVQDHISKNYFEFDRIKRKFFSVIYSLTSIRNPVYMEYGTVRHKLDLSVPKTMPESGIYLRIDSILEHGEMPIFEIRAYHTELFYKQANKFKAHADKLLLTYDSIGKTTV